MRRTPVALLALLLLVRCLPPELSSGPSSGGTAASLGPRTDGEAGSGPVGTGGSGTSGGSAAAGGQQIAEAGAAGQAAEMSVAGETGAGGDTSIPTQVESIDDMEDGDVQISVHSGRNGFWFTGNDGSQGGTQSPAPGVFEMASLPAGERSMFAAHTKVSGFKTWGSLIGFTFVEQANGIRPYDASAACGVTFWAKAATATTVNLQFADANTHPAGGVCSDTGGMTCLDHFYQVINFTTKWQEYFVYFSDLVQLGFGYGPPDGKVRQDALYSLNWRLPSTDAPFEIWLDDLGLVLAANGHCL